VRKFLPLVLALMLIAPLSVLPSVVQGDVSCAVVTTGAATNVGIVDATLNGVVNVLDGAELVVYFEYGTDPNSLDQTTPDQAFNVYPEAAPVTRNFSATITDLLPCRTYYARAVVDGTCRTILRLPSNKIVAGFGLDPVTFQGFLNAINGNGSGISVIKGEVISFTTICPSGSGPGNSGGGVGGGNPNINLSIPPLFAVQSATVAAAKAAPGEMVEVTAMVTNKGGSNGTSKIVLYVNGQEADSKGIALSSGQSTPVSFKVSRNDPGTYQVSVNGVSAGSFTVDLFNSNDMLIYGSIALFAVGMIGLLYYIVKRRPVA